MARTARRTVSWSLLITGMLVQAPRVAAGQADTTPHPAHTGLAAIAGIVHDSAGDPMANVEVAIPVLSRSTRSDSRGAFQLDSVDPGYHEVWLRRIGYITTHFDWPARADERIEISVKLRMLPHTLDPVIVRANEDRAMASPSNVSGFVLEPSGIAVPDAEVQLLGTGRTTLTKDDGSYSFRHVNPGTVAVRARRMGFTPAVDRAVVLNDDDRKVTLYLTRLAQTLDPVVVTERTGYGADDFAWREFDLRVRFHSKSSPWTLLTTDLARYGKMPLDLLFQSATAGPDAMSMLRAADSVRHIPQKSDGANQNLGPQPGRPGLRGAAQSVNPDQPHFSVIPDSNDPAKSACILENGKLALYGPLRAYGAEQIETLEYYAPAPPESEWTGTVAGRFAGLPQCALGPLGEHPAYYVLWLKGAR